MIDDKARWLLCDLDGVTEEVLADPLRFGPWTRATYREIGVDLDDPNWRDTLEDAKKLNEHRAGRV